MAKAKKVDLKQVLLAKGEYVAVGVAGLFLAILLVWGASRWAGAKNPEEMATKLTKKAQDVQNSIGRPLNESDMGDDIKLPAWLMKPPNLGAVPVGDFPVTVPQFDPIAKPDTKRENPTVWPIGAYQVDLVRGGMKAYDIVPVNDKQMNIGVIVAKKDGEQDKKTLEKLNKTLTGRAKAAHEKWKAWNQQNQLNNQPGGMGDMPGPMGIGGGGPGPMGLGGPGRMMGGPGRGGNVYGGAAGSGFDSSAQRLEKAIEYIPLEELDTAISKGGKVPAMTVVPLRMVTIHAEIPYKRQVDELKRALRLPTAEAAKAWLIYDGYEVQRKVSRMLPGMKEPEVLQDWAEYKFEDRYVELINARKFADQFEDGYVSYFISYDQALALPLPQLVDELGKYPEITLKDIKDTIEKLKAANRMPVQPSDLLNRLNGRPPRDQIYRPQTSQDTGAAGYGYGSVAGGPMVQERPPMGTGGMGSPMPGPVGIPGPGGPGRQVRPGDTANATAAPPVEIDHLLLRFVDVDVKPGYTYEYKIRLRMLNPNEGMTKEVANPAYAKVKELYSPWSKIAEPVPVPAESFLYAVDPAAYRKKIEEEYKDQKEIRERMLPRDNQAAVEVVSWMEQVRTDAGGKREPIGAWVVADMPVGRGEYIGRKQYIKLPLWSSEASQYILREIDATSLPKAGPGSKSNAVPKGWLVDFSTKSVLVDFEGGKVVTRSPTGKNATDEAATEMLIVRPDGKLVVKSSAADEEDKANEGWRKQVVGGWEKWIKDVEARKAPAEAGMGMFDRKMP